MATIDDSFEWWKKIEGQPLEKPIEKLDSKSTDGWFWTGFAILPLLIACSFWIMSAQLDEYEPSTHWQSMGHLGQVYARALTKCHQKQIPRDETENGTANRHVYEQKEGLFHGRNQGFEDVDTRDGRGNQAYGG